MVARVQRYAAVGVGAAFIVAGIWWRATGDRVGWGLVIIGLGIVVVLVALMFRRRANEHD